MSAAERPQEKAVLARGQFCPPPCAPVWGLHSATLAWEVCADRWATSACCDRVAARAACRAGRMEGKSVGAYAQGREGFKSRGTGDLRLNEHERTVGGRCSHCAWQRWRGGRRSPETEHHIHPRDDLGPGEWRLWRHQWTPRLDRWRGRARSRSNTRRRRSDRRRERLITASFQARWGFTSFLQTRGQRGTEMDDFLPPIEGAVVAAGVEGGGVATAHIGKWHLGGGRDVTEAPKFSASATTRAWHHESPSRTRTSQATNWNPIGTGVSGGSGGVLRRQDARFLARNQGRLLVNLWPTSATPWVPDATSDREM